MDPEKKETSGRHSTSSRKHLRVVKIKQPKISRVLSSRKRMQMSLVKAAELGNSRAALKLEMRMEKEGKESECAKFY